MLEAVKVALDPTPTQERLLSAHAGAARFAFNAGLAHVKQALEAEEKPGWSLYALRRWWNANKNTLAVDGSGVPWWPENSKESYNSGLEALSNALSNWSKSRRGRRVGFPRFRSKDRTTPRFAYTTGSYGLVPDDPKALRLPRIGRVHCMENVEKRVGGARVLRMTVSRRAGRWYAALTVERADDAPLIPPKGGTVGVDLGVRTLAVLSDGTMIANPHALGMSERRLKHAQKALSRKTKGWNRRRRARERVARLHAHVADQRRDLLDKLTTWLTDTYSDICIEGLNVSGMVGNHRLAKAIEDASFAELRRRLEYKTARTGARLHVIDRWYPSSKRCSNCGRVKAKLSLSERVYHCDGCGLEIDRDLNAAINIKVAGSAPETLNAHGADVRPGIPRDAGRTAVKCEPSSHENGMSLGADTRKSVLQAKTN